MSKRKKKHQLLEDKDLENEPEKKLKKIEPIALRTVTNVKNLYLDPMVGLI